MQPPSPKRKILANDKSRGRNVVLGLMPFWSRLLFPNSDDGLARTIMSSVLMLYAAVNDRN